MTRNFYYRWHVALLMLVIASGCASATKGVWSVNAGNGGGEKKDASIEELLRLLDSRYEEI
ncbi:MAG: hypothetical protein AAB014_05200, partial [Nitrospirota bacterium]